MGVYKTVNVLNTIDLFTLKMELKMVNFMLYEFSLDKNKNKRRKFCVTFIMHELE